MRRGGEQNSLERQGTIAIATEEMSNRRSGGNKGGGRGVERKSIDVPKERSRDYQRKVEV